ncbi:MAG TPA: hypothetical protein PKA88_31880, partial [Polyangiaceae bacterium]|nr:hypothetical protein [Polyangiaceae bacterium]
SVSRCLCGLGLVGGLGLPVACAGPLPSERPLGKGPLFTAEEKQRKKRAAERETALANAPDAPPKPTAQAPKARPKSKSSDAGAGDAPKAVATSTADAPKGDAAKPPATSVAYAGVYVGQDTSLYKLSGLPDRSETDANAKTRVEDRPDGGVFLIPVDSSSGKDICKLHATVKNKSQKTFEINKGQRCFEPEQGGVTGTVRSGSAKLGSGKLVFDVVLAIEVNADSQANGSLDYHFEGTRQ